MARIDRLIQAAVQNGAERLVLASGERITIAVGGELRPVSPHPATLEQVRDLLTEIAPPDPKSAGEGAQEFRYAGAPGTVSVQVVRTPGAIRLELTLLKPGAPAGPSLSPVGAGAAPLKSMETLFKRLVAEGCSDLHLTAGYPPLFRKDGEIVRLGQDQPIPAERVAELLLSITPDGKRDEFRKTHDLDFGYEIAGLARFRCNLFEDRRGMGGVFRVIPASIQTAAELGLPPHVLGLCDLHKGLVLVTGPTGSGKSTTLAAMVDHINRNQSVHIITIEDPIEFVHPTRKALINQREVGNHTEGFKRALRAALREDPDIVLVGEMRDLETVSIAIETAETGHLVFGTLHTNTAPSTVDRIIDQFPPDRQNQIRTMLSESLKGVITQTLCRKKGGGRVAALEILLVNAAVSNLIREGKTFQIPSIMQTGKAAGMITLSDALFELVRKDLIDAAEAYACAVNKSEFKALLDRNGVRLAAA
jgi:twitching motility protein PilT